MEFAIGMITGGLAAWFLLAVYEVTWDDIFPDK